ncbi:MAG TPA: acetyl-CoA carboxylase, biotin carboxyl carrier protein, partial [Flavobacterium sp.]|nr:acetyl-CoA carboxylase, biotin carboxyl carrier protein [Flavobacterium sp.]
MDLKEIQNLIKFVANSGVAEVKLEMDDVKITIRTTLEGNVSEATYVQMPVQPALQPTAIPQQISPAPAAAPIAENA